MPLRKFKFYGKPDIRLVTIDQTLFKIKMTCQHAESRSVRNLCRTARGQTELEKIVRGVLFHDIEDPVRSENFTVYPYKKKWPTAKRLSFSYKGSPLQVSNFMYIFYVEPRSFRIEKDQTPKQSTCSTEIKRKRKIHDEMQQNKEEISFDNICSPMDQRTVVDYGQKNRYEVESQNLQEQLRLQEMAQSSGQDEISDQTFFNAETQENVSSSGLMNSIKKFFTRS